MLVGLGKEETRTEELQDLPKDNLYSQRILFTALKCMLLTSKALNDEEKS